MFEQTFVDETQPTKKTYTLVLSLLLQIAGICALILLPLVYTQVLPSAQLKSELVAPPRPPLAAAAAPIKRAAVVTRRLFHPQILYAPAEIPKQIKDLYKTVWEISQKTLIDMAGPRCALCARLLPPYPTLDLQDLQYRATPRAIPPDSAAWSKIASLRWQ